MMTKDEMVCSECGGIGGVGDILQDECPKCLGTGKLDWIENVVGKRDKFWGTVDEPTRMMADNFIKRIKSGDIVNQHRRIYKNAKVGD